MAYAHVSASDKSVTALYGERTAATSSQYLLPYLTPTTSILDVGCGPGVITSDLSKICHTGRIVGVDNNVEIIAEASSAFPTSDFPNLTFEVRDANDLSQFGDNTFDVVHGHALLVHVKDPVAVLKEFSRIVKPGGFIAIRESNPESPVSLTPDISAIKEYWARAMSIMTKMGGHADAGAKLQEWAKEAGLDGKTQYTTTLQPQPSHLVRCTGVVADQAVQYGMATKEEMDAWRKGWEQWEASEGHEWLFECGEILVWKK